MLAFVLDSEILNKSYTHTYTGTPNSYSYATKQKIQVFFFNLMQTSISFMFPSFYIRTNRKKALIFQLKGVCKSVKVESQ